ncbi:MAG: dUTP diphosphatase [Anaerovoracaceae bacterium]
MKVKINCLSRKYPEYASTGSAGVDIKALLEEAITVAPMERYLVPTGIFLEIPEGFEGQLRPRSGLSIKHGISLVNCVGTIDSDYRGEVKIPIINLGSEEYTINNGERIAQLVLAKYEKIEWKESEELADSQRGEGGFGHTGK